MLGRFIQLANAGLSRKELEYFYPLKQKLLARFGVSDGYAWQYVEKICFACDGTGESDWGYGDWDAVCPNCGGDGYWKRFWTMLERRKIGKTVFHTPVKKFQSEPDEPFEITINGYINHAPVSHRKALWAFFVLAIMFDIGALLALVWNCVGLKYYVLRRRRLFVKIAPVLDDLPF